MSIYIKNGRLIDPRHQVDMKADLYIAEGKVVAIGDNAGSFDAAQIIDASGLVVCPGFVDLSVGIPEPGYEQKGTVASETRAAAAGGITSLCCPPDTAPVIDSPSVATLVQDLARQNNYCHLYPVGAMTVNLEGRQLSEIYALKEAGCIAVSNLRLPYQNHAVLLHCLEYAATHDITVFFSSTDVTLEQSGCVHEGAYATRLGLGGIPETAETIALSRDLLLVEQTGVRAHFGQLSTARSVELIAKAQEKGFPITADVAIQHLVSTDACIQDFNAHYHIQPPLRTEQDRQALLEGVRKGTISAISSYHQPHESAAKMAPFAATEPGISGVETLLPYGLGLVRDNVLELTTLISRFTTGPAQAARIKGGTLGIGDIADICIFDPDERWALNEQTLFSKGHNTPQLYTELQGRVRHTLVAGQKVHQCPG